jgi:diguanylate cyclase (GGDEF)-like protein
MDANSPTLSPASEDDRLAALARYDVLDTPAEASFDRITRIAKNALGVPMAAVSLIDGHRQWFKSRQGPLGNETCKSQSFCNVAIRQPEPLVIEDATADPRFKDNPLVLGPPHIRAYAGTQLRTLDGFDLGALCAIDTKPRCFEETHIALLKDLAGMVMDAFEAQKLSRIDGLTGALTRRAFREEAERAIALASRHHHPLSCIAFDLDHFKAINDQHGHAAGDSVLVAAVEGGRRRLRGSDILGRIGGEEFAVVLPHTDAAGARKAAEEIRTAIAQLSAGGVTVTASFGMATLERPPVPLDELLRRADIALYEAKAGGRNACVAWARPADPSNMRRVLKAGQIVFNAGRSVIDCTVRGLCESGARLDVASTAGIPENFKLSIVGDGLSRACNTTAKHKGRLEVAFA